MSFRLIENMDGALLYRCNGEKLLVEAWGENGLRVRATMHPDFSGNDWALSPGRTEGKVDITEDEAVITNGKISAKVLCTGQMAFFNRDGILLEEYWRTLKNKGEFHSILNFYGREYKGQIGGDYQINARFESDPDEKLFGMGQYQIPMLNLKGCALELAQRNSQISVPFALSDKGYGFLWNNPAIGEAVFGMNRTEWLARSCKELDYWITAGDSPAEIVEAYANVTGTAPMMPDYGMGFWQCKLRYQTQEELLNVAREHKRRGIPLSVIVADFYHWTREGDWKFDERYWPDPKGMVRELEDMGVKLMVSVWPTVEPGSENFEEMEKQGLLVRAERGKNVSVRDTLFFDATNPESREFVWDKIKQNYYGNGIRIFWLDAAEPEYEAYDFDNYRYQLGPALQVSNIYPQKYAQTLYEGMQNEGQENIVNLIRSAWAGSQRYGALVWSGDIYTSFRSLRWQMTAGLNIGLAGIPWWNTDIGGFIGGRADDPAFVELLIRWFQFGTFCPVMRMHGFRYPTKPGIGPDGGGKCESGADNEVWSYGDEAYEIMVKYINLRERLRPYITELMRCTHERGVPVMRPLFYDFPGDKKCWEIDSEYMFGPDILVAPILHENERSRAVYLPAGTNWVNPEGTAFKGGQEIVCDAPIDVIPVFAREGASSIEYLNVL